MEEEKEGKGGCGTKGDYHHHKMPWSGLKPDKVRRK